MKHVKSFEIINVGTWPSDDIADLNRWKTGRMIFIWNAKATGGAAERCVVGGWNGNITLGYAW